jgi:hypothetical protein
VRGEEVEWYRERNEQSAGAVFQFEWYIKPLKAVTVAIPLLVYTDIR